MVERGLKKACASWIRTGACRFGSLCKWGHPDSATDRLAAVPVDHTGRVSRSVLDMSHSTRIVCDEHQGSEVKSAVATATQSVADFALFLARNEEHAKRRRFGEGPRKAPPAGGRPAAAPENAQARAEAEQ